MILVKSCENVYFGLHYSEVVPLKLEILPFWFCLCYVVHFDMVSLSEKLCELLIS